MIGRRLLLAAPLTLLSPSIACAIEIDVAPSLRDDGWPVAKPSDARLDPAALAELVDMIDAGGNFPNVHSLVIEHRGRLVFERYWPGEDSMVGVGSLGVVQHGPTTLHDLRSVSKSVTSLLLGIALGDDAPDALTRPITSFFPERADLRSELNAITLHHVLTMTAGLAWNETFVPYGDRNDFFRMYDSADPVGFILGKETVEEPGSHWNYHSGLTDVTAALIENLTGEPITEFAAKTFFDPLGITEYAWLQPPNWNGLPSASAGLRMRARDLAKIGSLVLLKGQWRGQQIVSADWIAISTKRHVQDNPWGPPGAYGYGFFWFPGKLLSGHKVIRATGYGDQRIYVLPEIDMAITLFAGNYADGGGDVGERIVGRVLRALP